MSWKECHGSSQDVSSILCSCRNIRGSAYWYLFRGWALVARILISQPDWSWSGHWLHQDSAGTAAQAAVTIIPIIQIILIILPILIMLTILIILIILICVLFLVILNLFSFLIITFLIILIILNCPFIPIFSIIIPNNAQNWKCSPAALRRLRSCWFGRCSGNWLCVREW